MGDIGQHFPTSDSVAEKDVAFSPFPLRVRGWKMLADVTHGKRSINSVSYSVHSYVCIRMPDQPMRVWYGHPA